jgi:predicted Zn-dependent peptidase
LKHTVEEVELSNGARGLLINIPHATVMSYMFGFRAGYFTAPEEKWDVPHILEHMMFGANERFAKAKLYGAEFEKNGAYHNATTSKWHVTYDSECAEFEWDRVLELQLLALARPVFLADEFRAEKGNVYEELTGFFNNYFRVLGGSLAQAAGLPIFTDEQRVPQLPSITINDIKDFYAKTHGTRNLRFIIAGPIYGKKTKLLKLLRDGMKPMPLGQRFDLPEESASTVPEAQYLEHTDVKKLHFYLDMYIDTRLDEPKTEAMNVLNDILTGTLHSRILGSAREKGIVYGMGSGISRSHTYSSWWFGANVNNENAAALTELIRDELQRIADGKVLKKDIEAAKQLAIGRFQRGSQRVSDHVRGYSARYMYDESIDAYDAIPQQIQSVQKADITKTAQSFFKQKTWGFGMLGNASQAEADALRDQFKSLFKE